MMKIGMVGSGTMGNGIAQVMARNGFQVVLCDMSKEALDKATKTIEVNLTRVFNKQGKDVNEVGNVIDTITFTTDMQAMQGADIIIEAIVENMEVKKKVFTQLDALCEERTIFASNTSGLSITELAAATTRSDRVIGMHFFNPVRF